MSRTSRRVGHRAVSIALGFTTLLFASACSIPAPEPSRPRPVAPAVRVDFTHSIPAEVVAMVLPVSGADTRWTQGLNDFGALAADKAVRACAAAHHVPAPPHVPPAFVRFSDFPDLEFIAHHGFNGVIDPAADGAASDRLAPGAADRNAQLHCLKAGQSVEQALAEPYAALQMEWWQDASSLRTDPAVASVFKSFGSCMAGHNLQAPDERAFFALADGSTDTVGLGTAYAACMEPIEAVREPLRKKLNERFRTEHKNEIARLTTTLVTKIHDLEERYDIQISFPEA